MTHDAKYLGKDHYVRKLLYGHTHTHTHNWTTKVVCKYVSSGIVSDGCCTVLFRTYTHCMC